VRHPARIVCLVPSLTEALFVLGLGDRVVGVTDYCVHPAADLTAVPRIGGTKNPDLAAVGSLAPDLVIANQEENKRVDVERLEAAGIPVWVTYPRTVSDGVELLGELAQLGASRESHGRVVAPVERAFLAARETPPARPARVFCPIWKKPWMAVGAGTYADDLMTLCGGANVFGDLADVGDRRYPIVRDEQIEAAAPDVILLPDEPYSFGPRDAQEIATLRVPAAESGRIHLIDGTLVTWYGPRIRAAIETLQSLLVLS
jgi:ABC-type Fe3+-hydroxamate transport system substrate-binding protein